MTGIVSVINTAAFASPLKENVEKMQQINVEATKKFYLKAKNSGIKHWIQISSSSVLTGDNGGTEITEESNREIRSSIYAQTKSEADNWLRSQDDGIKKTFIYPGYMLGIWDSKPSSGAIFFALKLGRVKYIINNTKNFVSAKDVANGIIKIAQLGLEGEYILGGSNENIMDFIYMASNKMNLSVDQITEIKQKDLLTIPETELLEMTKEFCLTAPLSSNKSKAAFDYTPNQDIGLIIDDALGYFTSQRILRIRK